MSVAIQHALPTRSTAVAQLDAGRDRRASPVRADGASERAVPNSRHALLGAIAAAVEALAPGSDDAAADAQPGDAHAAKQALHGFVHALLAELRPGAGEGGHGRGFAWGRTTAATLGQRLDALVARLQGGSVATPTSAPSDGVAATTATAAAASDATPSADAAATPAPSSADAAAAPAPSPAAASPLLTAFRELATARGAGEGDGATGGALVALLQRVASAVGGDVGTLASTAGSVLLDATA